MAKRKPSIKGDKHNMLTLRDVEKRDSHRYWVCDCECGKETISLREDRVVFGITKSCGCLMFRVKKDNPRWGGCGDLDGAHFSTIRWHAKRREIEFNITIEYVWSVFLQQERRCAITNILLNFESITDRLKGANQTASLDRIDSSKGYVEGNVWWVHKDINVMKSDHTMEYFKELCRLVTFPEVTPGPSRTSPEPSHSATSPSSVALGSSFG